MSKGLILEKNLPHQDKAIELSKKEYGIESLKVIDTLANSGDAILKQFKLKEPVDFVINVIRKILLNINLKRMGMNDEILRK